MKKFSGVLLAGVFVLSTAVPTFAADLDAPEVVDGTAIETVDGGVTGQEVKSEGTLKLPTISVTIPTTHGFLLNPYNLEEAGQIVSAEATISNASTVDVDVSLKSATAVIENTDPKAKAVLGMVTDKITSKTVELNLIVTPTAGTLLLDGGKLNITGKNAATKLVTLNKTNGAATLKYEGKTVANPLNNPWSAADKISLTSIYTFSPVLVTTP
ncbi:hypothetical protein [Sporosarcina ureae]|uniref:hypothetical protein n=1 Tax=Sporosarcina ureae TaxID=1571 RepID=UPI0028AE801C|nr:hypothetical protein [Sporosarcina ureae]